MQQNSPLEGTKFSPGQNLEKAGFVKNNKREHRTKLHKLKIFYSANKIIALAFSPASDNASFAKPDESSRIQHQMLHSYIPPILSFY
jgi:hypothetical protein